MDVTLILLGISLILFFGYFAEFVFQRFKIPDVLALIVLGFVLGPYALGYIAPGNLALFAPIFTTFTLLFLLFDGAFSIDITSFAKGLGFSIFLTFFNFIISSSVIFLIMYYFGFTPEISLLTGFILGGISSSVLIPLIKNLPIKRETYSILTLESALTDVFCIVFAITMIEMIQFSLISFQEVLTKIISMFSVAAFVGVIAGMVWIVLVRKIFREHKSYMMTISFLVFVYVITEFLKGNGAIAALFFGFVLKNSRQLMVWGGQLIHPRTEKKDISEKVGEAVTTSEEQFFYDQISFFLKTFFFVYIGVLINFSDMRAIVIGGIIAFVLLFTRPLSSAITKAFASYDKKITNALFGRGLASAAVAGIVMQQGIPGTTLLPNIIYIVITGTIILSSLRVFFIRYREEAPKESVKAKGVKAKKVKAS